MKRIRFLAILLTLCMIFALPAAAPAAQDQQPGTDYDEVFVVIHTKWMKFRKVL